MLLCSLKRQPELSTRSQIAKSTKGVHFSSARFSTWDVFNTGRIRAAAPSPHSLLKFSLTLGIVETKIQISKSCETVLRFNHVTETFRGIKHFKLCT